MKWEDPKWVPEPMSREWWRKQSRKDGSDWSTILRQRLAAKNWIKSQQSVVGESDRSTEEGNDH